MADGAASRDGQLRQGDVLVYVNGECVLGYTHQDVVEIFQSIAVGQAVQLSVCRGYPLSIDPDDPNIEIMPLAAINNPHQEAADDEQQQQQQREAQTPTATASSNEYDEYYCDEYDELYATVIKGPSGFGFTIADDAQLGRQKIKQILDKERCRQLAESDVLLDINGVDLCGLTHVQVVDVLKECARGIETVIRVKRRKFQPQQQQQSTAMLENGNVLPAPPVRVVCVEERSAAHISTTSSSNNCYNNATTTMTTTTTSPPPPTSSSGK